MKAVLTRIKGGEGNHSEPQTLGIFTAYKGLMKVFECLTLERPWADNKRGVSCIPDGEYQVRKWHNDEAEEAGKRITYNHFQVLDVPDRTGILIHVGNYVDQIEGCILPGTHFADMNKDGLLDIGNSTKTLADMFNKLPDTFTLKVVTI